MAKKDIYIEILEAAKEFFLNTDLSISIEDICNKALICFTLNNFRLIIRKAP